ncbi:putative reverse transcriptase domain-containing protein [Tanacetum coccineum]
MNRVPGKAGNQLALEGSRNKRSNGNQVRGRAFNMNVNAMEAVHDPNVVTGTFSLNDHFVTVLFDIGANFSFISTKFGPLLNVKPSIVNPSYVIEVADGKKVEVDRIIRDCKLELESSLFSINLIPLGHGSFDVIVGMDWLSQHKAVIVCHEKVVEIPVEVGRIHRVHGERTVGIAKVLKSEKKDEPKLGDKPGREDVREVFQQRGSGAKRKLSRCGRNQIKDLEACLKKKKGEGDCLYVAQLKGSYEGLHTNVIMNASNTLSIERIEHEAKMMDECLTIDVGSMNKDKLVAVERLDAAKLSKVFSYSTEKLAKIYIDEIVVRHGVLVSIISDRYGRFKSRCWQTVQKALGTSIVQKEVYVACFMGLIRPELVQETTDKVVLIKEKLKAARDRQKSYADNRRKPLEFEGKLAPRYVGPFEILERIGPVAYRLRLPEELSGVHDTFHVSNLKKCLVDASLHVPLEDIKVDKTLCFVEEPVEIMDREVKSLKRSKIALVKVRWNSKRGPEFTWEREDYMKSKYPQLFVDRADESAS